MGQTIHLLRLIFVPAGLFQDLITVAACLCILTCIDTCYSECTCAHKFVQHIKILATEFRYEMNVG